MSGFYGARGGYIQESDDEDDEQIDDDSMEESDYDYGTEDITDESEILRQQKSHLMAQKANMVQYQGPGSKPIGSQMTFG